jgi:hypothetical protein
MKHNFKTEYISGIDASNTDTIPDTSPTHPVDKLEPTDSQTDYLKGVAVGMRLNQRIVDWLFSAQSENQMHTRLIGCIFCLNMDDLVNHASIAQVALAEGINRQYLYKVIDQTKLIIADDPAAPRTRIKDMQPEDEYKPHMQRGSEEELDDPDQLTMFDDAGGE